MSRISGVFEQLKARGERALVPYLTAGFPHPDRTVDLLGALVRGGADIIEIGVPFSDPIADGPTIQASCGEALAAGTTLKGILEMVRRFRQTDTRTPIVLFGALNPFLNHGPEAVARDAAGAGADAFLIPDMPPDEGAEMETAAKAVGMDIVYLVAPTTPPERKREICARSSGFVYYISVKGVTGAREAVHFALEQPLAEIRAVTDLPVAVGFGISSPAQAAEVGALADAVVVGSALVSLVGKNRNAADLLNQVEAYMRSMKAPLTK